MFMRVPDDGFMEKLQHVALLDNKKCLKMFWLVVHLFICPSFLLSLLIRTFDIPVSLQVFVLQTENSVSVDQK